MAQMWLLWWPKNTCTTPKSGDDTGAAGSTATTRATTGRTSSLGKNGTARSCCNCRCLARFMRKVKKQSKEMVRSAGASRQSSFQCRYDPLSYSLNFDRSGCGSSVDDEDYYQFYAFSSRFVANPRSRRHCSTHMLPAASQRSPSTISS
ncbi:uncharacterized protein LOC110428719 [Herrania umbratica]|uniref:Uncharacterized protein LOC110428719 n=1 Tax=Herrania umbratica TaxID=108875 RepID=A0A6J1BMI5_9ROSI|nr:uncharacterized protein LOC110428719 [Herrania umbratica]